jgi:hypothetical protein
MKKLIAAIFILLTSVCESAPDTLSASHTVLIVPYNKSMHLSDADMDISNGSEMEMPEMRETLRDELVKSLNKKFAIVSDYKESSDDFVKQDEGGLDYLYHSLLYSSDSVYTLKDPQRFAVKDTIRTKDIKALKKESNYINVQINDQYLIPDLSKKYKADYIIFLNEFDIKTHFDDCINLALRIYRRDLKVHYSIFDKYGKQVYGDVAVAYFDSNSNDVNEIAAKNFPVISDYILQSFDKAAK